MKVAALADIHGNLQALITVLDHLEAWKPDQVLILGDIINRGPRSKECLDLINEKARQDNWQVIKGNHEDYVLSFENPDFPLTGPDFDMREIIYWTYQSLSRQDIQDLIELPEEISIDLPGRPPVKAAHGSTAGDRVGIYPDTPDRALPGLIPRDASLFLVGHTHQPLIRTFHGMTIVNAGSVGLPFDGDTRAAYAQLTYRNNTWEGKIARVDYDLAAAEADFHQTGFIPEGGPMAELVLAEMRLGWPQLGKWFRSYEIPFRQQQISLQDAVYEFLKNPNIEVRKRGYSG